MKAVYATDLSEAIDAAIDSRTCLECLARYGIEEVHLITVVSPNIGAGLPGSGLAGSRERALDRQRRTLHDAGFDVEVHVARGTPHRRINGLAGQVDADLILVGSRGQSPLERRLIGSTARNVARTAVRPLLIERIVETDDDHEVVAEHLFERILYATDFSENADRAFEQFRNTRRATDSALLLHVVSHEHRDDEAHLDEARTRLDELATELGGLGIDVETSIRDGEPVEEILAAEADFDPTTILMGARGRSRLRRLLLGSVSEDVIARPNANVLLVPPSRTR